MKGPLGALGASLILVSLYGSTALAQSPSEWRSTETKDTLKEPTLSSMDYKGVKPGKGNPLPRVEQLRGQTENWVTWPGFMPLTQGSRVFLQTTRPVEFERQSGDRSLTLVLKGCKVFLRNNRNPLIAEHFNTPVRRAWLKETGTRKDRKIELLIALKTNIEPQISQYTDNDGFQYLLIDFPPGDFPMEKAVVKAQGPGGAGDEAQATPAPKKKRHRPKKKPAADVENIREVKPDVQEIMAQPSALGQDDGKPGSPPAAPASPPGAVTPEPKAPKALPPEGTTPPSGGTEPPPAPPAAEPPPS